MRIKKKHKVVIDTNIFLVSISSHSKYHWIFQLIINQNIDVLITNDILLEYEEIISLKFNKETARNVIRALIELTNVIPISIFYNFDIIKNDPDDNKFIDCAIAGNADYIVTNDKDYNILKSIDFPKVTVFNIDEFKELMIKGKLLL